MPLYFEFNDIEIDKDRFNAIKTYQNELKTTPNLSVTDKAELISDIVRGYIWQPHSSFD